MLGKCAAELLYLFFTLSLNIILAGTCQIKNIFTFSGSTVIASVACRKNRPGSVSRFQIGAACEKATPEIVALTVIIELL